MYGTMLGKSLSKRVSGGRHNGYRAAGARLVLQSLSACNVRQQAGVYVECHKATIAIEAQLHCFYCGKCRWQCIACAWRYDKCFKIDYVCLGCWAEGRNPGGPCLPLHAWITQVEWHSLHIQVAWMLTCVLPACGETLNSWCTGDES